MSESKIENYISVAEFAKAVSVTAQAVHRAIKDKRLKNVNRVGAFYLISKDEIALYKERKR